MVIFRNFLKTKSDQNIHQNAPNCTILKSFIGGTCPRTPLPKRMASRHANFQIWKKKFLAPPCQILGTTLGLVIKKNCS